MAARQDTLGKGRILEAYVYSNITGKRVPVMNYLMNIDIYEDIFNPFVYCDLVFLDYDAFARQFPLAGEEYLVFTYQSINGKPVRYHFLLYKMMNVGMTATNSATGFVMRGVTLERAMDSGATVSTAYRGTCSEIAAEIFKRYIKVNAGGLEFNYEPSRGIEHFIPPQISPLNSIYYLKSKAVSISEVRSPFLFFRNSQGYYFRSMNGLFNDSASKPEAQIVHRYAANNPSAFFNEESFAGMNADIIEYNIGAHYDTLEKIDLGGFNAHTYSFDLTTKWFGIRQQYNATDFNGKFQLGGQGMYNRNQFMSVFDNTRCVAHYVPTDISREFMGTTKDSFPDYLGEMAGYMNLASENNISYTIYGDSDVTAGQVMKILVPMARDRKQQSDRVHVADKMFSGSFLLSNVKHSITFGENVDYYTVINGINGARDVNIEKVASDG